MGRTKTFLLVAAGIASLLVAPVTHAEEQRSGMAYVRSGDETLPGFFYKPEGKGPFPAVVLVRAASRPIVEAKPPLVDLAKEFTGRGYVVVVPNWHMPEDGANAFQKNRHAGLPDFRGMARDVAAAVNWAKTQSYVDENRVAVIGHASGAIMSILLAEQEIGVRGYVVFSPAAMLWKDRVDLQKAFVDSIREAKAPIFLIQPQNDFTLAPSEALAPELVRRHDLSLSKVYPPFGTTREQGNTFAMNGSAVWGDDVFKFLQRVLN